MAQQSSKQLATSNLNREDHQVLWVNSPIPQAVYQLDGIIIDANPAFANLIGCKLIETVGRNIWSIIPLDDIQTQIQRFGSQEDNKLTIERVYIKLNNQLLLVKLSTVKIKLEDNNLFLLTIEIVNSLPTLCFHPDALQLILNDLPLGISWKDSNSVYLGCNQVFADILGLTNPQEIVGKTDHDLAWQKKANWLQECDRTILESEIAQQNIIKAQPQSDTTPKWLKLNSMLLRDASNDILGILVTLEDITARVDLEKQLKQQTQELENLVTQRTQELISSKAEFEKLVLNVPGAIYKFKIATDGTYSFPYISSDCEEICEYTSDQVMKNPELVMSQIHPGDISNFEKVVQRSAQTLNPKHWEGRIINPSGKTKWIQTASKPERQPDGSIIWDGLMSDISDRKRAEQALRESQQLLHLVFDTLPQRVFWKDCNSKYLGCNQLFAQDAGLKSPAEIVGKTDFDLTWRQSAHLYRADDRVILAGGRPKINYEESQIRENRARITLRTSKLPLKDKNGNIIGVFGCYEDISDISRQKQQVENTRFFLEQAIDSIKQPIFIKNTQHQWVLLNNAYCEFLGYPKAEMIGKSERDFFSPQDADIYWAKDELVMLSGNSETDEEPYTNPEGYEQIIVTQKSCFQDLNGDTFLLGMIIDIRPA
ncbi:signal transduction histidine kinase [Chondrocystis sp. NIES-4102]|nr:signal transduction histidine kinase [Chondrocystis sp. NIES-4102]